MSKRVKQLLLCGMTLRQWIELIIKRNLDILSVCNVRLSCSFFGETQELKYLLYTARKTRTLKRSECVCNVLNCVYYINISSPNEHYRFEKFENMIIVELKDDDCRMIKSDIIDIISASRIILKTIRDRVDVDISWITKSRQDVPDTITYLQVVEIMDLLYKKDGSLDLDVRDLDGIIDAIKL